MISISQLDQIATRLDLKILKSISISQVEMALDSARPHLLDWQKQGFAGEMSYMKRSPDLLLNPRRLLENYKSILVFAVPYFQAGNLEHEKRFGYGRIARYAWGRDYHLVLRDKLNEFVSECQKKEIISDCNYRVFADSVPLLEKVLAERAGLGFLGKSGILIRPKLGTYFFICEIIWDIEVSDFTNNTEVAFKAHCGSCIKCKTECPTSAIVEDKVVDARKCISYLTIEKKTIFDDDEVSLVDDWVFGCDVCQEVCPFNSSVKKEEILPEFSKDFGAGPYLNLKEMLGLRKREEFKKIFQGTPLLRTKREGLLRNVLAVIVNQKYFNCLDNIIRMTKEDESEMLRLSAIQALRCLRNDASGLDLLRINKFL